MRIAGALKAVQAGQLSTPATAPGAPTIGTASPGDARATVAFLAPASNGGSPILDYEVTRSPGGQTTTGTTSPITVTGLTNGTAYTFTVKARNAVGLSLPSAASNAVTPVAAGSGGTATVPGAPGSVSAVGGNTTATVSFAPPASNGGAAISSYKVTSNPDVIMATGTSSPITVQGLTNGTSYTFVVSATNLVGEGPASAASNAVIPAVNAGGTPAAGGKLIYAPPTLSSPTRVAINTKQPADIVGSGGDLIIDWNVATNRRFRIQNWRHVVIIGGEVYNDVKIGSDTSSADLDERAALQFDNCTGTIFVEGLLVHGTSTANAIDGIRIDAGAANFVCQNTRITNRYGIAGSALNQSHADCIQPFGGIASMKFYQCTFASQYQGIMFKNDSSFGPSFWTKVNLHGEPGQMATTLQCYAPSQGGLITASEFYSNPQGSWISSNGSWVSAHYQSSGRVSGTDAASGRQFVYWQSPNWAWASGSRLLQGVPSGGDFCPVGRAGLNYVSPGYV